MSSLLIQGYGYGNPIAQGFHVGPTLFVSAIRVEDGSCVPGANSYVTLAEVRAYAKARNKSSLFANTAAAEAAIIQAGDYLQAITCFAGRPTFIEQSMLWPRDRVWINGIKIDEESIPPNLKKAQIELAMLIASGVELYPVNNGKFAIQKTVGPITTKYSEKIGFGAPDLSYIDNLLAVLFGFVGGLRTYRV